MLLSAVALAACSSHKKPPAPYDDPWVAAPIERYAGSLDAEYLSNDPVPGTVHVDFSLELPKGLFHDPTRKTDAVDFGVWTADGLSQPDTPFVSVRFAPFAPKTLDALVTDATLAAKLVSKQTLDDGSLSVTTRNEYGSLSVEQLHIDPKGHVIRCYASRTSEHVLGEPTWLLLERICSSLKFEQAR